MAGSQPRGPGLHLRAGLPAVPSQLCHFVTLGKLTALFLHL